jgi:hypothetical protein
MRQDSRDDGSMTTHPTLLQHYDGCDSTGDARVHRRNHCGAAESTNFLLSCRGTTRKAQRREGFKTNYFSSP